MMSHRVTEPCLVIKQDLVQRCGGKENIPVC